MARTPKYAVALTVALSLVAAPNAMAVGESGDSIVTGVVTGTLALVPPTGGVLSNINPSTDSTLSAGQNVVVANTGTAAWAVEVNEPSGDGKMSRTLNLPICSNSAAILTPQFHVISGAATGVTATAGSVTAELDAALPTDGSAADIATAPATVTAATIPVTFKQPAPSTDTLLAGCSYTITTRFTAEAR